MSPKLIAAIFAGTAGGGVVYFYHVTKIKKITKHDIEITTPQTTPKPITHKKITCNQTKIITITKLKNTLYYLCDTVTDTNSTYTQITKASMVFPDNVTFATSEGSHHTIIEWAKQQDETKNLSFYWFNDQPLSEVDKSIFFIHNQSSMNDEVIKDMIVNISRFKNESNHTPTHKPLQQLLHKLEKTFGASWEMDLKKNNNSDEILNKQSLTNMIQELTKVYTHAAVIISKLELWISKYQTLKTNNSTVPIVILESRVDQLGQIIQNSELTSKLGETEKTKVTKHHVTLTKFIADWKIIEKNVQSFIKQLDKLLPEIYQHEDIKKRSTVKKNS